MQIQISLDIAPDRNMKKLMAGLTKLTTGDTLEKLLQEAMRKTILEGVRKRFAANQATMALVSVANRAAAKSLNSVKIRNQFIRLSNRITKAQQANDQEALNKLHRKQAEIVRTLTRGAHKLSSRPDKFHGALRAAARQRAGLMRSVRDVIAGQGPYNVENDGNRITVSVGAIPLLNRIKSPSATTLLTGHASKSLYQHLWLQMEFGMGVYAKPSPVMHGSPNKTATGSWWYGARKGQGVHFLGQKPGNLLRTKTVAAYPQDTAAFQRLFASQVTQLVFGA